MIAYATASDAYNHDLGGHRRDKREANGEVRGTVIVLEMPDDTWAFLYFLAQPFLAQVFLPIILISTHHHIQNNRSLSPKKSWKSQYL